MSRHDNEHMLIHQVVDDQEELQKIRNEIIENFAMLKDLYHHLQSKSEKTFPLVDAKVLKKQIID